MENRLIRFEAFLRKKQLSQNTIKVYVFPVYTFFNIYRKVTAENVLKFQNYLEEHYSPNSANLYAVGFNRYLHFIGKNEYRMKLLKYRQTTYLDNVLSYAEYCAFKKALFSFPNKKWYFIVWALASTGVRISELVQFKIEDVERGYLNVKAKGNKIRRVFIPRRFQYQIIAWLKEQGVTAGPLFRNYKGEQISVRGISKGLERNAKKVGINPSLVHPHAFRHLFAKKFLESKGDISMLADLLGHESLDTTKIYLRKTSREQKEMIDSVVRW